MLSDESGSRVVSSLGWVDRGNLWVLRPPHSQPAAVTLSDAKYLSLHPGEAGFFSVAHHFDGDHAAISVHNLNEPEDTVARAVLSPGGSELLGDATAWSHVQTHYVVYYAGPLWSDFCLIRVHAGQNRVELQRLEWYNDEYDKGYQGVTGAVEVPGHDLLIVSVQRNSHPVLYDPVSQRKVGILTLAGRGGNPALFFRRRANELWADDYDTVVKLEPATWRVLKSRRVQSASFGTGQFIGQFSFDPAETLCIVARPYSRDVIALDPQSLRTRFRCKMNGQPIEAVMLPDRSVIARDWKTGALLRGQLRRSWSLF